MKKIFLFLIALLATFGATAVNYFSIGGVVNDTLLINPSWINTGQWIPVQAHFDGRVDEWTINVTYSSHISPSNVIRGRDMDIPFLNNNGIVDTCHAQITASSDYTIISSIITDFGYWNYEGNGILLPYGTVKWEAGDYDEMFKIFCMISSDCTGDTITLNSNVDGSYDWRGGTTNGMFLNRIYLKVGYQRGDVNGDGLVNIGDVSALTNYLLTHQGLNQYQLEAADFNRDGNVTIADETALTNWLLMNGGLHSTDLDEIL